MNVSVVPTIAVLFLIGLLAGSSADSAQLYIATSNEKGFVSTIEVPVRVGTVPDGLLYTVDGIIYTEARVFMWPVGTNHTLSTPFSQGSGQSRYVWDNWSDGGEQSHTVSAGPTTSYYANFRVQYLLTMSGVSPLIGILSPGTGFFDAGQMVQIRASALPGASLNFRGWTGSGNGSYTGINNPASIVMNGPITESADTEGAPPTSTPTPTPSPTATPACFNFRTVGNSSDGGSGSLRQAVADVCPGGVIDFEPGLSEIQLNSGQLLIPKSLTILGPGVTIKNTTGHGFFNRIFYLYPGINVTISGLTITGGRTDYDGGGILSFAGSLTLINCSITGNNIGSGSHGGGIATRGNLSLINTTVSNNSASYGGGFHCDRTESVLPVVNISNSTFSGNTANYGGGLHPGVCVVTVTASTITGNQTLLGESGGIVTGGGGLSVSNTIIAGNFGTQTPDVGGGSFVSSGYNLVGNAGNAPVTPGTGDQIGTSGTPIDPKLGPLTTTGGLIFTHALLPGSPAIDKGKATGIAPFSDQRGLPRPYDDPLIEPATSGDNSDIGAYELQPASLRSRTFDFDGDSKADVSVFRPSNGLWFTKRSGGGEFVTQFGIPTDKIAPADYDGDGKTDVAVYRPMQGTWYVLKSSTNVVDVIVFGFAADLPVPGDYDGDGRADVAVYRQTDGTWYLNRTTAGLGITQFGANNDVPAPGDYDGDGESDLVVWRPSNGVWFERRSTAGDLAIQFGASTDKIAPADYDGDGMTDVGVYRPFNGTWYSVNSSNGSYPVQVFGLAGDIPVPADYDGDGCADIAIFRPSNGQWWIDRTTSGMTVVQFGSNGDKPTMSAFGN